MPTLYCRRRSKHASRTADTRAWVASSGFEVYHETHRKRFLHSPWVTRDFLPKFPNLKLVADLSHWVCVAETDTADEELNKVIKQIAPQVRRRRAEFVVCSRGAEYSLAHAELRTGHGDKRCTGAYT